MIQYFDVKTQDKNIITEINDAIRRVACSGSFILGEQLEKFENRYASYCDTNYALGVANGLDALAMIFTALTSEKMIDRSKPVLVPENTFIATVLSILQVGLKVELYKVKDNFRIDFDFLESLDANEFSMIVFVPLYGNYSDAQLIQDWSKKNNLHLVEDAAQAHGAVKGDIRAGNIGIASSFSFYPSKNLGCYGDGGAITTNDQRLDLCLRKLRNYGFFEKYKAEIIGRNSRLDEIQAAILNVKLNYLNDWNLTRYNIAKEFSEKIINEELILPFIPTEKLEHVFHVFPVRVERHIEFETHLRSNGIQTNRHYPVHLTQQPCLERYLDNSNRWHRCEQLISLPCSPALTKDQQSVIIEACNRFV